MTDALKAIVSNTAHMFGGEVLNRRYIDLIDPQPEETRTADDVRKHIEDKLRRMS